jgi:hypothetical protein
MDIRPRNGWPLLIEPCWMRRPGARETQVAWRQVHFAPKSAPQHRDFGAGKVGLIK